MAHSIFILLIQLMLVFCNKKKEPISYYALGDSYTFCEGTIKDSCWVDRLTSNLKNNGIEIELIGNLGVSGYSTQNLIDLELPQMNKKKAGFVTILIGANDIFQGVPEEIIKKNIAEIINKVQEILSEKKNIILLTVPDYSVTSAGKGFNLGPDFKAKLLTVNNFIKSEALNRGLQLVDIYNLSLAMEADPTLTSVDGLHPSGKEYLIWEKEIRPVALKLLK